MTGPAVTVIGGGAIGGITAACLVKKGFSQVIVVDTWEEHVEAMRRGLKIEGCRGDYNVPLNAVTPDKLNEPLDLVLLAVKSAATKPALEWLLPFLHDQSTVVSLQNGINEDLIAGLVGREKTVGCMVGWGATSLAPGHLVQTSPGEFVVGGLDGQTEGRPGAARKVLANVTGCQITANIYGFLWTKLIVNCVIAVGALQGKTVGETVSMPQARPLITAIVSEGLQVAAGLGITLETLKLKMEPEQYIGLQDFVAEMIIKLLEEEHGHILPSIYQDILKGRPSEIDYINGYVAARSEEVGVETPFNRGIVEAIHQIEKGEQQASPKNIIKMGETLLS